MSEIKKLLETLGKIIKIEDKRKESAFKLLVASRIYPLLFIGENIEKIKTSNDFVVNEASSLFDNKLICGIINCGITGTEILNEIILINGLSRENKGKWWKKIGLVSKLNSELMCGNLAELIVAEFLYIDEKKFKQKEISKNFKHREKIKILLEKELEIEKRVAEIISKMLPGEYLSDEANEVRVIKKYKGTGYLIARNPGILKNIDDSTEICITQHGGECGEWKGSIIDKYEREIFGKMAYWRDIGVQRYVISRIKSKFPFKKSGLLIIGAPKFNGEYLKNISPNYHEHLEENKLNINKLIDKLRKIGNLVYKPHPQNQFLETKEFDDSEIFNKKMKIQDEMAKFELIIFTCLSHTLYYLAVAEIMPFVIVCSVNKNKLTIEFRKEIEALERSGLLISPKDDDIENKIKKVKENWWLKSQIKVQNKYKIN